VTSTGVVSEEDLTAAYTLLVVIGWDEARPCRRDSNGRDIKKDMTPTMIKEKAKEKEEKLASDDDNILESGRPKAKSHGNKPLKYSTILLSNILNPSCY
jgi:hypothetical protein